MAIVQYDAEPGLTTRVIFTSGGQYLRADNGVLENFDDVADYLVTPSGSVTLVTSLLARYTATIPDPAVKPCVLTATAIETTTGEQLGSLDVKLDAAGNEVQFVYYARVKFNRAQGSSADRYTVTWYRDAVALTSGITTPTIQVVNRADGTDLVASTALTQIGSTGSYKYDEATNRLTKGLDAVVVVTASIDGATRTWSEIVGRDSP